MQIVFLPSFACLIHFTRSRGVRLMFLFFYAICVFCCYANRFFMIYIDLSANFNFYRLEATAAAAA